MKKIVLIVIAIGFIACKSEKKETNEKIVEPKVEKIVPIDTFSISINAIIEHDDTFSLFYLEEGQKSVTKNNSVSLNVKGLNSPQELVFSIEEEVLPTKIFIRFGNEEKIQKISFLSTKVSYGEKFFIIENEKFYQFFIPNKFIRFDTENYNAISEEIDGEYKPRFGSRLVLIDKIFYDFD